MIRAARHVVDGDPDWTIWRGEGQGGALVFLNQASVQSHCLGFLIVDSFHGDFYRSPKRALRCYWTNDAHRHVADRASMLARLALGGRDHDLLGKRKKFIDLHIAERDGDPRAGEIRARIEADHAALGVAFRAAVGKEPAP